MSWQGNYVRGKRGPGIESRGAQKKYQGHLVPVLPPGFCPGSLELGQIGQKARSVVVHVVGAVTKSNSKYSR